MPPSDSGPAGPFLESYARPGSGFASFRLRAMATETCFLLLADDTPALRKQVQGAFDIVLGLEQKLSKFLPESEVSLVNTLGAFREVLVGPDLLHLLAVSRRAWEVTGGAFDPTVGPLLDAWGFVDRQPRRPTPEAIDGLLAVLGMDHVHVDAERATVRFDRPGVSIDLGGIGKGYAVDQAVRHLRESGIEAGAVVSGRSSIVTWGTPPGEDTWRLGIGHPDDPETTFCVLRAAPGAVSSSGAYERRMRIGDEEFGHVIDPRTGVSARTVDVVTLWTPTALSGDVLSTALFVLGAETLDHEDEMRAILAGVVGGAAETPCSVLTLERDGGAPGGMKHAVRHVGSPAFDVVTEVEDGP